MAEELFSYQALNPFGLLLPQTFTGASKSSRAVRWRAPQNTAAGIWVLLSSASGACDPHAPAVPRF